MSFAASVVLITLVVSVECLSLDHEFVLRHRRSRMRSLPRAHRQDSALSGQPSSAQHFRDPPDEQINVNRRFGNVGILSASELKGHVYYESIKHEEQDLRENGALPAASTRFASAHLIPPNNHQRNHDGLLEKISGPTILPHRIPDRDVPFINNNLDSASPEDQNRFESRSPTNSRSEDLKEYTGNHHGAQSQDDLLDASSNKDTTAQSNEQPDLLSPSDAPLEENQVEIRRAEEDMLTKFLRIVETQHLLGDNCTAGTDLNLGEGVVDRYAQERFRVEAEVAVNRANMLTRLWKYADPEVLQSEYLLHASVFSMVEFDDDIFAAGNCYDKYQYKDYWLFCPYAYRLPEGPILVKDLAVEYKYLSNTSEWFYIARKNAERVISEHKHFSRGFHTYTLNESAHTQREPDEILSVAYEDGKWSKPYYDCGGGNIWMLTYTVPFFGFRNGSYHFKGTSGIDIDLRRVDIDQCPLPPGSTQLNIFAASDKCKKRTTQCVPVPGLGFRRGSYKCVCRRGFFFPDTHAVLAQRHFNGSLVEDEFEKLVSGQPSAYGTEEAFQCLPCAEGCDACLDSRPCVASLNWALRTAILALTGVAVLCLPAAAAFTWKYGHVKVVRAASPALLRFIALGAFFIYGTVAVAYPNPNVVTCTARVWLREIGFVLTYGALMLKTWRISVIFRVRSARAVRITDGALLRRLGALVGGVGALLAVRTLVAAPRVVVGRTAEGLKAPLCRADWWDHAFSALEALFLVWGIRLCIVVRKAPSEFNESRFISMAIYNEFLLSVFLNISMLFLQSPANPDLLYIIFFVHTQLTVTMLLGLIFGSKVWLVMRTRGKPDESSAPSSRAFGGCGAAKLATASQAASQAAQSSLSSTPAPLPVALACPAHAHTKAHALAARDPPPNADVEVQEELRRLQAQLERLRERSVRAGDRRLAARVVAMQEAALLPPAPPPPPPAVSSSTPGLSPGSASPPQSRRCPTANTSSNSPANGSPLVANPANSPKTEPPDNDTSPRIGNESPNSFTNESSPCVGNESPHGVRRLVLDGNDTSSAHGNESPSTPSGQAGGTTGKGRRRRARDRVGAANAEHEAEKRALKSGHSRTHAIVINLDDRSRFTEEVTV